MQKAYGTYKRNQQIRKLYPKVGNMAVLGRRFGVSRQCIRTILAEASDLD